ncbi:ABC transporter substrate-binding protein [Amycolatopsis pithecellobii]|uniref:ABC transporter substrate-binding protein n=1 Tax=Amycolatopsis pithecellobii TaxID=664692 RepID=A0A6N7Z3H5_9PSEU|nr:ABC transporter substrate-binding protein [Amycolatopsis pithecellobii]MTD55679.1 ABC transporter substrate-binding protein [Amycolatopsis pithecellobii]
MKVLTWRRRSGLVAACGLLAAAALAACGGSSGGTTSASGGGDFVPTSASCQGDPVKFGVISVLTGDSVIPSDPSVVNGAKAAAAALTKSCQLGRPVAVISCDSKDDPNQEAACGRRLVSENVVAFMGSDLGASTWFPITSAAGIPEIGGNGLSSVEVTSPLWYPLAGNVHDALAYATVAASALQDKVRATVLPLDNPGVSFFLDFFKRYTEGIGGTYAGSFPVPADTVDMSQFAAQVKGSGANAVYPILAGDQFLGLVQQMVAQGNPLTKTVVIQLGSGATCKFLKQVGTAGEGLWLVDSAWPVAWNTKSPGAQQYIGELNAAGLPSGSCDVTEFGVQGWSAVHIMADLLKGSPALDAKTLVQKLNTAGPITRSELPGTIDWSRNPFPNDPALSKLRVASNQFYVSRIVDGKPVMASDAPVTIGEKFTPKN